MVLLIRHQIPKCLSFKIASGMVHLIRGFTNCHNGPQETLWCDGRVCVCVLRWGEGSKADSPSNQLSSSINWWHVLKTVVSYKCLRNIIVEGKILFSLFSLNTIKFTLSPHPTRQVILDTFSMCLPQGFRCVPAHLL